MAFKMLIVWKAITIGTLYLGLVWEQNLEFSCILKHSEWYLAIVKKKEIMLHLFLRNFELRYKCDQSWRYFKWPTDFSQLQTQLQTTSSHIENYLK
jgi:hypothetical protein